MGEGEGMLKRGEVTRRRGGVKTSSKRGTENARCICVCDDIEAVGWTTDIGRKTDRWR